MLSSSSLKFGGKVWSLAALVVVLVAALISSGCAGGNSTSSTSSSPSGTPQSAVQVKIGDAPADGILAFEVNISKIDLTPQSGTPVTVLSTPREIELTHLSGTLEPLALANVPSGTYTGSAVTVGSVNVTYIPAGSTTPVQKQFALNSTVNITFNPSLTVGGNASVVSLDFNLAQSLTFDSSGNLTGIAPVFNVTTATPPAGDGSGEDDEHGSWEGAVGQVTALTPASGNAPASFALTMGMSGQTMTFNVDSSTQFSDGISQFSDLKTNMMLKVNAVTQSDGSLLAKEVEMLEANEGEELAGMITDTTGTPVTSLNLLVNDEFTSGGSSNLGNIVTVDVSTAVFKPPFGSMEDPLHVLQTLPTQPVFDSSHVGKGQNVELDMQMPTGTSLIANSVRLRKQTLTGTVQAATSGTGVSYVLVLDPNSAFAKLTGVTSIPVYEVAHTQMMTKATVGATVRVRGFVFFDSGNYEMVAGAVMLPQQ